VPLARLPFGPEAPGSIRRRRRSGFHQPPDLSADARRVLVPFTARSSIGPRSLGSIRRGRQGVRCGSKVLRHEAHPVAIRAAEARTRRRRGPAGAGSAGTERRSATARRARTAIPSPTRPRVRGDRRGTTRAPERSPGHGTTTPSSAAARPTSPDAEHRRMGAGWPRTRRSLGRYQRQPGIASSSAC
jgi:hypothetical protein